MSPIAFVLAAALASPSPQASPSPAPAAEQKAAAQAATERERRMLMASPGQARNVRVDVTIREEQGGAGKHVSLTLGDFEGGAIRLGAEPPANEVPTVEKAPVRMTPRLDVDARPVIDGNRVRLRLGILYNLPATSESSRFPSMTLREDLNLVLEDGKPLVAAVAADPLGERHLTVEVTATILR